ncbi:MAG: DSD1 family PLP-dependent enzyme [Nitrososphaeria archaeon]
MEISDIDTPALILDLDIMDKNLSVMKDWLSGKRTRLRAHFKTPKATVIAWREIEYGASGVCCQTLSEAEVVANAGIRDILITNQIVQETKIAKMIDLLEFSDVKCLVDNLMNAKTISSLAESRNKKIGVLVEVDVGMNRCGVQPSEALSLAKAVSSLKGLEFKGIQAYDGHLQMAEHTMGREKKMDGVRKVVETIKQLREDFEKADLSPEIVSGAGTGTYRYEYNVLDEVQAGSYALMDWRYKVSAPEFDMATTILTRVISIPSEHKAIIDCGMKACSTDSAMPKVKGMEDIECKISSEEHGLLDLSRSKSRIRLADAIELYPAHICTTVNLHNRYYVVRRGELVAVWPINARDRIV